MLWIKRQLRGNRVYVRARADGEPAADTRGMVEIVYKLAPGAKVYRASARNLQQTAKPADAEPFDSDVAVGAEASTKAAKAAKTSEPLPKHAIVIYTDGACTGNPGPAGIGAVIMDGDGRTELSEYLGQGTNNIAELTAIKRALEEVPMGDRVRPVVVHSDSSYSIGLMTRNWKAKKNVDLVAALRKLAATFRDLRFIKVKGHAGIPENERCDELARQAIDDRR